MAENIGLQELIDRVKQELLAAPEQTTTPLFYVEGVELELAFTARREGSAGIKLYVAELGVSGAQERVQRVSVSLKPLFAREELRRLLEEDAVAGAHLRRMALRGSIKGGI